MDAGRRPDPVAQLRRSRAVAGLVGDIRLVLVVSARRHIHPLSARFGSDRALRLF